MAAWRRAIPSEAPPRGARRYGAVARKLLYVVPQALAFAIAVAVGLSQPRFLDGVANFVFDSWQRLAPRAFDADGPVRIVAVDEASLAEFGQWPWPRTRLAEVTRRLAELGAAAVVFDIIFAEPDRTSLENVVAVMAPGPARDALLAQVPGATTNDAALAEAVGQAPVVLGATLVPQPNAQATPQKAGFAFAGDDPRDFIASFAGVAAPLAPLAEAARGVGATNWLPDRDQVIRRVPLVVRRGEALLPALSLEALRVAEGASTIVVRGSNASGESAFGAQTGVNALKVGDREIATGAHAEVRPYYTPTRADRFISIARALRGDVSREEIEGRIVFVGTTAIGLGDVRATPLDAAVAGVEIQAQITEALVANAVLARPDWASGAELVSSLLLFALVAAIVPAVTPLISAIGVAALVALCAAGSFLAFDRQRVLLDPALPSMSMAWAYVVGAIAVWRTERISRQRVRAAFGKFLAPAVVERLAADPRGLVLGGETRELTIMFSDLRNFSGISEGLDAQELTTFMNAYLTPMTDAILDSEGTIDKYIGDAIVAFWNAPLDVPDHPRRAVEAALAMRRAMAAFNAARRAEAEAAGRAFSPAGMGIGVNLGPCTVGNMGSVRRFDYSVLGDAVNLASRLEGVSKMYGVDLIASEAVVEAVAGYAWIELDRVRVKGRQEPTTIYTLAGDAAFAREPEFLRWRDEHDVMLAAYRGGALDDAVLRAKALGAARPDWAGLYKAMVDWFEDVARTPHLRENLPVRALDSK